MTVSYTSPKECDSAVNFGLSATDLSSSASNPSGPSQYTHTSKDFGSYTSNYLHHITLTGLSPATTYHYGIPTCSEFADICSPADAVFSFTTAPLPGAAFPTKFAIVGDLGQTANSLSTVMHIHEDSDVAAILHAGDMSYSDCEQPRWDSWFSMIEFLAVSTPWYVCVGNHEVEYDVATGETFRPYEARFRMPQVHEEPEYHEAKTEDQSCCPSEGEYDYGNSFYSFEYGPSTVFFLNSYTTTSEGSAQYKWLEETLSAVDRKVTPWVIVLYHCPWYNSFSDHQGEKQEIDMKASMEDLFVKHRVNAVFSGHVHGYERTHNVAFEELSATAPQYVIIGDGGNREGHAAGFLDSNAPAWSAFRDNTIFGHGTLELKNETHAYFSWHKNVDEEEGLFEVADSVTLLNQFFL
ncbi:hypothetical protein TeGR_g12646 [Tetraparma gracilis]|uniref:Purple acid phosphatase n=1 Tax=Tetraparma gracilis TaxID=2962635 RepID=A0ABQ6MDR7_9STRA|nr:hypothetical protein TeGR_g12646 [Tetraparma gracilis]